MIDRNDESHDRRHQPPRPPAPPFDAQRHSRPHGFPPQMDSPPVQDIGEPAQEYMNDPTSLDQHWRVEEFKSLWCVFYGRVGFPMVVCNDYAQANTIAEFLNKVPGFDASDIPHTIWF